MVRLLLAASLALASAGDAQCPEGEGVACAASGMAFVQRTNDLMRATAGLVEDASVEMSMGEDLEGSRRRSRRRSGKRKSSRRRSRRRRRSKESPPAPRPTPAPRPAPRPAPLVADARATKVEAGWADMVKKGQSFTVFVTGGGFDPKKDRIVALDGAAKCGDAKPRLAAVTGRDESPGTDFNAWKALTCDNVGSGSNKLACGAGDGKGVKYSDDDFVDTYEFKVCVCDFSKKGNCDSIERFDLTPTTSTLTLNPVV